MITVISSNSFFCSTNSLKQQKKAANPYIYEAGTSKCLTFLFEKCMQNLIDCQ